MVPDTIDIMFTTRINTVLYLSADKIRAHLIQKGTKMYLVFVKMN